MNDYHEGAERHSRSARERPLAPQVSRSTRLCIVQKCAKEPSRELQPEARQLHARNLRSPSFSRLGWHCIRERAGGYDLARLHGHARLEALHFLHKEAEGLNRTAQHVGSATRFEARIDDPLRQWKLSPMDLPSRKRWYEYSLARDQMLDATDTELSPWNIVHSDDKKSARLNCIADLLSRIDYKKVQHEKVKLPERSDKHAYDDEATMKDRRWIRQKY